jgi:hypothetical protein
VLEKDEGLGRCTHSSDNDGKMLRFDYVSGVGTIYMTQIQQPLTPSWLSKVGLRLYLLIQVSQPRKTAGRV